MKQQRYVCELDGKFGVVEKTGRTAFNHTHQLSRLIEVTKPTGSLKPANPPSYWVPASQLFEIEGERS